MPFHVQCPGCMTSAYLDCSCAGEAARRGSHLTGCPMGDISGQVQCGCCPEDHDHDAAANSCDGITGAHDGQPCPKDRLCTVYTPAGDPCPGGHCAKGVSGCSVCRPLVITAMPGSGTAVLARADELRAELARLGVST